MRDPKSHAEATPPYTFAYENGRLIRDTAPTGGIQTLSVASSSTGWTVSRTSSLGRTTQHRVEPARERLVRSVKHPDQTTSSSEESRDGKAVFDMGGARYDSKVVSADGTVRYSLSVPHPVYGVSSSFVTASAIVNPSGLTRREDVTQSVTLDPAAAIQTLTSARSVNGRAIVTTYDRASRTYLQTTPAGRRFAYVLDAQGRVARSQTGDDLPTDFTYGDDGQLSEVARGARVSSLDYIESGATKGYLEQVTNALEGATSFVRDANVRVLVESAADARATSYTWDALGNLTGVTPPDKPMHAQSFDAVGQQLTYAPPVTSSVPEPTTSFSYNLDRQPTSMSRPDGVEIGVTYDAAGRIDLVTSGRQRRTRRARRRRATATTHVAT